MQVPREVLVEKRVPVVRRVEKPVEVPVPIPAGDPMILTEHGYIPLAEFAKKTQRLTLKQAEFYQRQSESASKQLARSLSSATLQSDAGSAVSSRHGHCAKQQEGESRLLDCGCMIQRDRPRQAASRVSQQDADQHTTSSDRVHSMQREPLGPLRAGQVRQAS